MLRWASELNCWKVAAAVGLALALTCAAADSVAPTAARVSPPGDGLFAPGQVHRIQIEIPTDGLISLRQQPRVSVQATVHGAGIACQSVGVHLKGSTGSFRDLDDKPGFTLDFDQFDPDQRFHGLSKIHLNNSVEDPSYLCEALGAELFRAAGVPAPRVSHALVELNGKPLGLYVLKEGFTREFLGQHFTRTDGNLYDTGSGNEITEAMKRNLGAGPLDRSDLKALAAAAQELDPVKRWQGLEQTLDVDRFVTFIAMEILTGHRDGYGLAKNNFRIYHDPGSGRLVFLPAGMDNLFGRADLPLRPRWSGLVAQALAETPQGRKLYRERLANLFTNNLDASRLAARVDQLVGVIGPSLDEADRRILISEAAGLNERIRQRARFVAVQLGEPEPAPLLFRNGIAGISGWRIVDRPAGGQMETKNAPDRKPALLIRAGPFTAASWRAKVILEQGHYRFEGLARTDGVTPLNFGKSKGAGLRVSGSKLPRPHQLTGTAPWTRLEIEFTVAKALEEVELLCELRASQGEAWFAVDSLRVVQLP